MILVALATLGATAVAFVLYPVFADEHSETVSSPGEGERELIALEETKTRLYEAITDLDFEKDSGKVSLSDYQTARNDYLAQVSTVLTRLDELSPRKGLKKGPKNEKEKKKATEKPSPEPETSRQCSSCSESSPMSAKFCIACGAAFEPTCDSCGEKLPAAARFCPGCGKKTS